MREMLVLPAGFMEMLESDLERRVMFQLLLHADGRGRCYPNQNTIADAIRTGRGAVSRTIAKLERQRDLEKTKRGRGNAYKIAERFLVSAKAPRQARSGERRQPALLLPVTGAKSAHVASAAPPTGAGSAHVDPPPIGLNSATTCADLSPGKRVHERGNPSSTTGLVAARETKEVLNSGARRASRAGPNFADPAVRRAKWMSDCIEWMTGNWRQSEAQAAVAAIVETPESPEAKRLLERASHERQARRAGGGR